MLEKEAVLQKIRSLQAVPSLKVFAASLRSMVDYEHDYREYLSTISKDPALTARVLSVANSALYYSGNQVCSLKDAADRLGLNKLKSIVMGHILSNKVNTAQCPAFDKQRYWRSAMLVANCSAHIAKYQEDNLCAGNIIYCIGLLHNIGVLALAVALPTELNTVLQDTSQPLRECEKVVFDGIDHFVAGSEMLKNWQLPEIYWKVIADLSLEDYQSDDCETTIIRNARYLVKTDFDNKYISESIDQDTLSKIKGEYLKDKMWVLDFIQYV